MTLFEAIVDDGLAPEEFAYIMRVHVSHIEAIIRGTQQPSSLLKSKIENYFDQVTITW